MFNSRATGYPQEMCQNKVGNVSIEKTDWAFWATLKHLLATIQ